MKELQAGVRELQEMNPDGMVAQMFYIDRQFSQLTFCQKTSYMVRIWNTWGNRKWKWYNGTIDNV